MLSFDRKQQNSLKQIILQLKNKTKQKKCHITSSKSGTFLKENIKYQQNNNCSLVDLEIYVEVKCKTQYFIV